MNLGDNLKDYIAINRKTWDEKTEIHVESDFYDLASFLKGKNSLNQIEISSLGEVTGKSILHLQCHFGMDTISLSKLGAVVTGVDFSENAIKQAQKLAQQMQTNTQFVCCDVYELPNFLNQKFDIVYTSYGTIGWLPDLDKWAAVISHFLKPGGRFVFVEFHPVVWMFDNDFNEVKYPYAKDTAIIETEKGTYADRNTTTEYQSVSWNHGLGEVVTSLLAQNLEIAHFSEYDYSPYNCFNHTEEYEPGKFRIKHLANKIPMVYALTALKKGKG